MKEIEVTNDILAELGYGPMARKELTGLFVKGPISMDWIIRTDVAAHATVAVLTIKMMTDMAGKDGPVSVPVWLWQKLGLAHRMTRGRVLKALEEAGFIRMGSLRGKPIQIWLIDKP